MRIVTLCPNQMLSNTYIIGEKGEPCIVIDPGYNKPGYFDDFITKNHAGKCLGVILTHTHSDHFLGLKDSKILNKVPLYVHEDDIRGLSDINYNYSKYFGGEYSCEIEPIGVQDNDEIKLGDYVFSVIHTPFHTKGSICLYVKEDNVLFSGDTIGKGGIGRTDLRGGSDRSIIPSLSKLLFLPDETKVLSGHGTPTTIKAEKEYGYLKQCI